MRDATSFRGQPLLVLTGVLCAWFCLRVAFWQSSSGEAGPQAAGFGETSARGLAGAAEDAAGWPAALPIGLPLPSVQHTSGRPPRSRAILAVSQVTMPWLGSYLPTAKVYRMELPPGPAHLAVGHSLLLAAGLSQMDIPHALTARVHATERPLAGVPAAAPLLAGQPPSGPPFAVSLLSADAWLMVRQDTASSVASGRPSYGRSQAGGVLRYRLAPASGFRPQAYVRVSSALQGALERDLVAGTSARPVPQLPLRFAAEARVTETDGGTELRPAVFAVTEFPTVDLPRGFRAEAYVQGGYVGGKFATAFVDGLGRVERPVARVGETEIAAGAGIWGGAQKGAARLDVGPTAAVAFRLGDARARVAADYRFRIAGDAEPQSGPAVTLSAGF